MAEECVDVPMITKANMSRVVGLRRHSSGKGSSGNNEDKVVPHYLRASTGSCHDFCKFGRKLALEAKQRSSIPKRAERKPLHRRADSEPTKMSVVKCSESVDTEHQISEVSEVLVNKNKTSLVRVKPSIILQKSNSSSTSKTRRQENSSSSKVDTTSKPASKRVGASPISASKEEPLLKSTSEWEKTHPKSTSQVLKTLSKSASKKTRTSSKLSSFKDKEMNLSEKHATSLSLDSCKVASPLRASLSSKSFGKKRLGGISMPKSLETVSHVLNQPKPIEVEPEEHNNEVEEKTLYVIKVETENQTFQSDQNASQDIELSLSHSLTSPKFSSSSISEFSCPEDPVESEYATSELEDDSSLGREYMENLEEALEVEENSKPQKDVDVSFEDIDCQELSKKLVETQIEESGPKRLEFKRGKVLEGSATDVKVGADNIDAIAEKIVLRHQDVKGKKDEQVLLNNVIEETASKLVKIQKSKVKALVDAFESIISLQEKNTYAANIVI